jgi:hypothetical protein
LAQAQRQRFFDETGQRDAFARGYDLRQAIHLIRDVQCGLHDRSSIAVLSVLWINGSTAAHLDTPRFGRYGVILYERSARLDQDRRVM